MSNESFEQELSTLFEQRKAALKVPEVSLEEPKKQSRPENIWVKLISILSVAGGMSFGVFAVISYLLPVEEIDHQTVDYHTPITWDDISIVENDGPELKVNITPSLPPEPRVARPQPPSVKSEVAPQQLSVVADAPNVVVPEQQVVVLDVVSKPETLPKLRYKVMPKYPTEAIRDAVEGTVTLSYRLDSQGNVVDIKSLSSGVPFILTKSARRALTQWRYASGTIANAQPLTVSFEFSLPEEAK